jgi:hypothetical protein
MSDVERHRYERHLDPLNNEDVGVQYLLKESSEEMWKQTLAKREKERQKSNEIRDILDAFNGAAIDLFRRIEVDKTPKYTKEEATKLILDLRVELEELRKFTFSAMNDVGKSFNCSVPSINEKWEVVHGTERTRKKKEEEAEAREQQRAKDEEERKRVKEAAAAELREQIAAAEARTKKAEEEAQAIKTAQAAHREKIIQTATTAHAQAVECRVKIGELDQRIAAGENDLKIARDTAMAEQLKFREQESVALEQLKTTREQATERYRKKAELRRLREQIAVLEHHILQITAETTTVEQKERLERERVALEQLKEAERKLDAAILLEEGRATAETFLQSKSSSNSSSNSSSSTNTNTKPQ